MKKIIMLFCILFSIISCSKKEIIHIYTPDKKKCVTIININYNNIRYIANGEINDVPDTNYIMLDIQNIDPLGDALHVCWNSDYVWDIVVHKSKVLESKLDTARYRFRTSLPLNEIGVPTEKKFRKEGCAIFSFDLMRLSPNKGAVVEF